MTYEQAIERIDVIVQELEKGDLPLEQSLKLFEEASGLTAFCQKQLEEARQVVVRMRSGNDEERSPIEEPFERAEELDE